MTANDPASASGRRLLFRAALLGTVLLSVIPALLVRIPPMLDYPNHYVRLWLITGGAALPPLSRMYAVDWSGASTNIAIDLVAWALGGLAPVGVIGPLVLMLAIALPPLGIALLGRRLFPTPSGSGHWWHLLCFLLAWNWVLIAGYLNFEISLGLALCGAALDAGLARHGYRALAPLRIVTGGIVLIAHPFGFVFYAALLGGLALGASFAPLRGASGLRRALVRLVLAALPVAVPFVLLVLFAPTLPGGHGGHHPGTIVWQEPSLSAHVSVLLTGIKTYRFSIDALFGLLLALPAFIALLQRRLRVHAGLLIVAITLTIVSLLMPRLIFGIAGVDTRVPCMVALAFAVAVLPDMRLSRRAIMVATVACMAVVGARSAWIGHVWLDRQPDFASLGRALSHVPAGAAVLPLEHLPSTAQIAQAPTGRFLGNNPLFWHYPTLAVMDRRAFVPTLFTAAGEQPIRVLPPWDAISIAAGQPEAIDRLGDPSAKMASYVKRWRECFDYILVVNADMPNAGGPLPASPAIVPIADEGFARLYRIVRPDTGHACR